MNHLSEIFKDCHSTRGNFELGTLKTGRSRRFTGITIVEYPNTFNGIGKLLASRGGPTGPSVRMFRLASPLSSPAFILNV